MSCCDGYSLNTFDRTEECCLVKCSAVVCCVVLWGVVRCRNVKIKLMAILLITVGVLSE